LISRPIRIFLLAIGLFAFSPSHPSPAQIAQYEKQPVLPMHRSAYPLRSWKNISCGYKGRFQDREYCSSKVIDQIIADGKGAIPILIAQISDGHWIKEPVYDYWPRIRTGELAVFILKDLFLDDTWKYRTMPDLFPYVKCEEASWVCWEGFRKRHSLADIKRHWMNFWLANKQNIYWDSKSRCFRTTTTQQ
jgi:hypothetical protein